MSRTNQLVAAIALAAFAVAGLSGCVGGGPVATKTDAIAGQLKSLPGVTATDTAFNEHTVTSDPHSLITLTLDPAVTADEVATIIAAFAKANTDTGLDELSSELNLAAGEDTLDLLYAPITDAQVKTLAGSWTDLRGTYASTALGMIIASGSDYVVNLAVGLGKSSFEGDLTALQAARGELEPLGDVGRYEQSDGRFAASSGLPDDAALSLLIAIDSVLAADGTDPDLHGEYDGLSTSFSLTAKVADSTDAASGLNAAATRLVAALPAAADGITIAFLAADGAPVAFFDDRSCDAYVGLEAADPSRKLLEYWGATGRTLLDGSTVASCFS